MIFGIDVASYQGNPDFAQVRNAGIAFVLTKLTEGATYLNPYAARTRGESARLGLGLGLYHFASAGDPVAEADFFVRTAGKLAPGTVLALDWETTTADPVGWCLTWLNRVYAATGVRPLLYLNKTTLARLDWSPVARGGYGLWLASYDKQPAVLPAAGAWPLVAVKQYADDGTVAGIAGGVDLDVFYGTLEQFRAYGTPTAAPTPAPAPVPAPVPTPVPTPWEGLPTLAAGQSSTAVKRLQQFLVRAFPSYAKFTPSGFYGDQTVAVLAEFQHRSGITGADADGRTVGPRTKAALWASGYRG